MHGQNGRVKKGIILGGLSLKRVERQKIRGLCNNLRELCMILSEIFLVLES